MPPDTVDDTLASVHDQYLGVYAALVPLSSRSEDAQLAKSTWNVLSLDMGVYEYLPNNIVNNHFLKSHVSPRREHLLTDDSNRTLLHSVLA